MGRHFYGAVIFPPLTIVKKELQIWITGWPVNQNQPNVAVHILACFARFQEPQNRKSLAQIKFSKFLQYKVINFQLIQLHGQASRELVYNPHYFPVTNSRDLKVPTHEIIYLQHKGRLTPFYPPYRIEMTL